MTLPLTRTRTRRSLWPWARLLGVLLLHVGVMAAVAGAFIADTTLTYGTEPSATADDLHPDLRFLIVAGGLGMVAFATQVGCVVTRRTAVPWSVAAVVATVLSAALQGWLLSLPFALRLSGDTSPMQAGAYADVTVLVLQVMAVHAFAVLLAVALVHACGGVEEDDATDDTIDAT